MSYQGSSESDRIKKLEELIKTANSLINVLSVDELPQAFRLAFKLLDQTGRNMCLTKTIYEHTTTIGEKRRHNSCSFRPLRASSIGLSPSLYSSSDVQLKYLHQRFEQNFLNSAGANVDEKPGMMNKSQDDFRSETSAVDLTAVQPTLDQYDSGSQSSGKDTFDATMSSSWLTKLKDDSGEDEHGNLNSSKGLSLFPNPPYPQCSSAPTLTASNALSHAQSPKCNLVNPLLSGRKDKRRPVGLMTLPSQTINHLTELEYSPKRLSEHLPSTGCPSKNWKITHSDRLNALIDECERIVDGRKVFKCKFCGKMYDIKSSMRYHMKIIHLQLHLRTSEMQCRICGKQFTCISAVNRHQLKCSANSSSNFTSTNPIQSSCGSSFLGKPRQSSLPTFANQSPSAFMHLNSGPGLRWSGVSGSGRHSNQSINNQIPFNFSSASETGAYMSPSVSTAFPSLSSRSGFDLDGVRFSGGSSDISPHQLANASLAHSVHHLVDGIPPLSFNEVFLASLGRSNGSHAGDRKISVFDDLPPSNFMGVTAAASSHNFLAPSPTKRIRKLENSQNFADGRIGNNIYDQLFPSQNEVPITVAAPNATSGAAIDLSLNAPC